MSKLALGTAQFGLNYGVANQNGQLSESNVSKILEFANLNKIDTLDTAITYGDSEKVLGNIGISNFQVVSKLPALPDIFDLDIESWVKLQVRGALIRLDVQSIYGLLLHRSHNLLGQSGIELLKALMRLKEYGLVKNIGISIYNTSELDQLDQLGYLKNIDLVQAPLSIIDRRLETSGWLSRLHMLGIEIHTRSTFLQGLLLFPIEKIPSKFRRWSHIWDRWNCELAKKSQLPVEVCLAYPLSLPEISKVIVGVDSEFHLKQLVIAAKKNPTQMDYSFMASEDEMLINPSNWSAL
jgi:aryl-alcohol dehydrogenase-like predicted oxidoreductase